jgi:hypothetical protein
VPANSPGADSAGFGGYGRSHEEESAPKFDVAAAQAALSRAGKIPMLHGICRIIMQSPNSVDELVVQIFQSAFARPDDLAIVGLVRCFAFLPVISDQGSKIEKPKLPPVFSLFLSGILP